MYKNVYDKRLYKRYIIWRRIFSFASSCKHSKNCYTTRLIDVMVSLIAFIVKRIHIFFWYIFYLTEPRQDLCSEYCSECMFSEKDCHLSPWQWRGVNTYEAPLFRCICQVTRNVEISGFRGRIFFVVKEALTRIKIFKGRTTARNPEEIMLGWVRRFPPILFYLDRIFLESNARNISEETLRWPFCFLQWASHIICCARMILEILFFLITT